MELSQGMVSATTRQRECGGTCLHTSTQSFALLQVIAIGDDWVSAATDKQFLRLFSLSGIQKDVLSLPGRSVAMAGWRNQLAIVYQTPPCECVDDPNVVLH